MIKAFWHESDNFGDKITPYILNKMLIPYEYVNKNHNENHYIMCGSILTACNEHSIIWGAGIAQDYTLIKPKKIIAVRGKKTRDFVLSKGIECPELYGDPSMMLPRLYYPKLEKKRKLGIIPHVVDYKGENWDLNKPIEQTIDYILESEKIVSSSLHAIITAYSYNIPFELEISPNVIGGDFKFRDFLETDYDIDKFINSFPLRQADETSKY